ncbi:LptE family protein [Candidatus Pelagibacter bacterium nBUS_49]|uniref:LptE family protein n=1 Tax=Candidatus Pelagibacter bacterium nBUS_49 TaxID=3374196 RepID=UPI003EC15040
MIKIKKLIPFFLIVIFLNNCGYTPRYALNKNVNFSINIIELKGDREFNNSLKSKIARYGKRDDNKKFYDLSLTTKYNKNVKSRDVAGLAQEYELVMTVDVIVKSELIEPKKIFFKETFNMKKFEDSFEEKNYEKIMKENLSDIILDRIIMYLFKL